MTSVPTILVQLIHIHGGLKGEIQELFADQITVGRLSSCSVRFPADEPSVSREHARIQREGNQFKLIDLSKYGTSVNGKLAKEAFLRSGDVLEFGPGGPKVSITMEIGAALPAGYPPPGPAPQAASTPVFERSRHEPPQPFQSPPPTRETYQPPAQPAVVQVQKTVTPLVIQFGPTIRSYRELPVTLGAGSRADFVIKHPGIQELHAQIFFSQGNYWIKDLTGQGLLKVNRRGIGGEAPLNLNDEIECTPQGPVFRFLGEGRLAEVEPVEEQPVAPRAADQLAGDTALTQNNGTFFSKLVKGFKP